MSSCPQSQVDTKYPQSRSVKQTLMMQPDTQTEKYIADELATGGSAPKLIILLSLQHVEASMKNILQVHLCRQWELGKALGSQDFTVRPNSVPGIRGGGGQWGCWSACWQGTKTFRAISLVVGVLKRFWVWLQKVWLGLLWSQLSVSFVSLTVLSYLTWE